MKRKMLFFERLMFVDGRTPINCTLAVRVRGTIHEDQLRAALVKLQARHPLLRMRVVHEGGEPLFQNDELIPAIPVRIVERQCEDDWQTVTIEEWQKPFDSERGPLLRIVWIRSKEVSEIMLVAHHCICDGGSAITLSREILLALDQPDAELAPYTSYSSLQDLVPREALQDVALQSRLKKKTRLFKLFLSLFGRTAKSLPQSRPYVLYSKTSAERFDALNQRCLAEGTNAYAALCVAYLLAFQQVQGKAAKNKIMCPVSIRRFIRSIKSDMLFAFAPTIELSLSKDVPAGFWERARRMKESITEKIDSMNVYEDLILGDLMLPYVHRIINFLLKSRGGHDMAFSNVGRLKFPTRYKNFQLETVTNATVAVPWKNTNTVIMTHFQNEMDLAFISNERFLPQSQAAQIQQLAMNLIDEAMLQPSTEHGAEKADED